MESDGAWLERHATKSLLTLMPFLHRDRNLTTRNIRETTKQRLFRWSLLLVMLAAFAVWLEPTRVVWGWLRGEAFYQGRPTSWWRSEISQWKRGGWVGGLHSGGWIHYREPSVIEKFASRFVELPEKEWPALL